MIKRGLPLLFALALAGCGGGDEAATTAAPTTTDSGKAPIVIESPGRGDDFDPGKDTVSGTASVYEATLTVELRQGKTVLARKVVTASEGAPYRGTFETRFPAAGDYEAGPAQIVAYAVSAANGDPQHIVRVPVELTP